MTLNEALVVTVGSYQTVQFDVSEKKVRCVLCLYSKKAGYRYFSGEGLTCRTALGRACKAAGFGLPPTCDEYQELNKAGENERVSVIIHGPRYQAVVGSRQGGANTLSGCLDKVLP